MKKQMTKPRRFFVVKAAVDALIKFAYQRKRISAADVLEAQIPELLIAGYNTQAKIEALLDRCIARGIFREATPKPRNY